MTWFWRHKVGVGDDARCNTTLSESDFRGLASPFRSVLVLLGQVIEGGLFRRLLVVMLLRQSAKARRSARCLSLHFCAKSG